MARVAINPMARALCGVECVRYLFGAHICAHAVFSSLVCSTRSTVSSRPSTLESSSLLAIEQDSDEEDK